MLVLKDKIVKARKSYHCEFCGKIIDVGEEHKYISQIYDGEFQCYRLHLNCAKATQVAMEHMKEYDGVEFSYIEDELNQMLQDDGIDVSKMSIKDMVDEIVNNIKE